MTTKQILDEMEKGFDEQIYCKGEMCKWCKGLGTCGSGVNPDNAKSFIHSYTRKLIESLAEEIIPMNFEYCDSCQALGVDNFGGWCSICKDALNANRRYNQQRLKVKEILSNLK